MKPALIFDMDGVIIDSNPFHKRAWEAFCQAHGHHLTQEELEKKVYGKTNHDCIIGLFGELPEMEIQALADKKEALYREIFLPSLAPVPGLSAFLELAPQWFETMAVATSAPPLNVDFTLDNLNIRHYFKTIVDETMVSRGKPDPEVYLTTATCLGRKPEDCVVIEDSLAGIQAAKSAGMKVIGITTTHSPEELAPLVDLVIRDFNDLTERLPDFLRKAFPGTLAQS